MSFEDEHKNITMAILEMTSELADNVKYNKNKDAYGGKHVIEQNGYRLTTVIEKISKIKPKKVYPEDSIEYRLAQYLKNWILKNNPKARLPKSLQSWCHDFNKMIRIDKRKPEEIKSIIAWCQKDDFWWTNIRSASKLRIQYDQLYIKMNGRAKQRDDRFDHL